MTMERVGNVIKLAGGEVVGLVCRKADKGDANAADPISSSGPNCRVITPKPTRSATSGLWKT